MTKSAESTKKPRGKAFKPGQSGNPGGRPKLPEDIKHVRELARQYTQHAVETLVSILTKSSSDSAKVSAANAILDRGWGKAEQAVTGVDGGPLQVVTRIELVPLVSRSN